MNSIAPTNETSPTDNNAPAPVATGALGRREVSRRLTSIVGVDAQLDFRRRLNAVAAEEKAKNRAAKAKKAEPAGKDRARQVDAQIDTPEVQPVTHLDGTDRLRSALAQPDRTLVPTFGALENALAVSPPDQLRRS